MSSTVDFVEQNALLDREHMAGVTAETNSGYVNIGQYNLVTVIVHVVTTTTTVDIDIEIATASGGTNAFTLKSSPQLVAADDNKTIIFDIKADELGSPSGATGKNYSFLNVEVTPNGAATLTVLVLGHSPRYSPVPVTGWDYRVS